MSESVSRDGHALLIERLTAEGATFRVVDHLPEGRTEVISEIRGNSPSQAAKAIVVMVKLDRKRQRYVIAVVPGDRRLDLGAVCRLYRGERAMFAPADRAQELTGCVMGAVTPFTFDPVLDLVVDPGLVSHPEIVFNAGRLDQSVFVRSDDYVRAAKPRLAVIAKG